MSIRAGLDKVLHSDGRIAAVPVLVREEMEEAVVVQLVGRLTTRFRQLDAAIDGTFDIAKEFVTEAAKLATARFDLKNINLIE